MYVFIKDELSLEDLAKRLRDAMNIPEMNKKPYHVEQKRDGINMGGEYYLLETFGLNLTLLRNAGEAELPEWQEWAHYIFVEMEPYTDLSIVRCMTEHVCNVAKRAGLQAEIEYRT